MTGPKKPEPHEVWDRLQEEALAEEGQRISKLTDAELDAEMRKKGLDPEVVRARGAAIAEAFAKGEGLPPLPKGSADKRPAARAARPSQSVLWGWGPALGAAAAVVALTIGVPFLVAILRHPPEDKLDAGPPDASPPAQPDAGAAPSAPQSAQSTSPSRREIGDKPLGP